MIRTLALALAALTLLAAPAHADDRPEPTEQVYVVSDTGDCWATPNATVHAPMSNLQPMLGSLVDATPSRYRGPGIGGGDETFRWVTVAGRRGCYLPADWTSSAIPGSLDPAEWARHGIVAPGPSGIGASAWLSRNALVLQSSPSTHAPEVGEATEGDVLATPGWEIDGNAVLDGLSSWRPVEHAGSIAWLRAGSLTMLPETTVGDLTSSITPEGAVQAWTLPGAGELVTELAAGEAVPAGVSPTGGWLPVAVDGDVAWVNQADLAAAPTEAPSDEPTTGTEREWEVVENGDQVVACEGAADRAAAALDTEVRCEAPELAGTGTDDEESDQPDVVDRIRNAVTGRSPVAEAAARVALWTSGAVALVSLLLAGLAYALTPRPDRGTLRRVGALLTNPVGALAAHAVLPAAVVAGVTAAALAPEGYYLPRVLLGAAVVGGALAWVTAHRVAALRRADRRRLLSTVRRHSTPLLLAAVGAGAVAHVAVGQGLALDVVAGLVVAGVATGAMTPAHLTHEPAHELVHPEEAS